jgi:hypothetical protein
MTPLDLIAVVALLLVAFVVVLLGLLFLGGVRSYWARMVAADQTDPEQVDQAVPHE